MQKQVNFQSARAHFRYLLKMWKTNAAARTKREKTAEADLANLPPIAPTHLPCLSRATFGRPRFANGTLVS